MILNCYQSLVLKRDEFTFNNFFCSFFSTPFSNIFVLPYKSKGRRLFKTKKIVQLGKKFSFRLILAHTLKVERRQSVFVVQFAPIFLRASNDYITLKSGGFTGKVQSFIYLMEIRNKITSDELEPNFFNSNFSICSFPFLNKI